jgi:hypothetical protein
MLQVHDGQCGACTHFGETHPATSQLSQIRTKHEAPETFIDDCGHPRNVGLHLTAISRCDGFAPAKAS